MLFGVGLSEILTPTSDCEGRLNYWRSRGQIRARMSFIWGKTEMHALILLYALAWPELIAVPVLIALYCWQTLKGTEEND